MYWFLQVECGSRAVDYFQLRLWVNDQLDAQLRYIIRLLLKSSTCFEQLCAHHQEVKLY